MNRMWFMIIFVFIIGIVSAEDVPEETPIYVPELNMLNTIYYSEGQTIELGTKVLLGPFAVSDAVCGVQVIGDGGSIALSYTDLTYNELSEMYDYFWVPTPAPDSFWDSIYHFFFPSSGMYVALMNCSGGSALNDLVLNDTAVIVVTS